MPSVHLPSPLLTNRERAQEWIQDEPSASPQQDNPILRSVDDSLSSVGYAMGVSTSHSFHHATADETDGGGVEAAPTSVLANYFLKSHGGAHGIQSVFGFLAVLSATGALLLPPSLKVMLIKRTMLFAMTKHLSGLLAGSTVAARAIPEIGLSKARKYMENLALDPVSQYVFYAALLLLWLPMSNSDSSLFASQLPHVGRFIPLLLVGPVLMREFVSTALVLSDVLVLLSTAAASVHGHDSTIHGVVDVDHVGEEAGMVGLPRVYTIGKSILDIGMSLVVTPSVWRESDAAKKQAILARLVSRTCLGMELLVGVVVCLDAVVSVGRFSIAPIETRPNGLGVAKRLVCARLYGNFVWVRRKRIGKLAMKIRGGAVHIPHRVLDILLAPKAAMGLSVSTSTNVSEQQQKRVDEPTGNHGLLQKHENGTLSWIDYAILALGLDE